MPEVQVANLVSCSCM